MKTISAFGMTFSIVDWSRLTGLDYSLICRRLKDGWTAESALSIPKGKYQGGKGRGHIDGDVMLIVDQTLLTQGR